MISRVLRIGKTSTQFVAAAVSRPGRSTWISAANKHYYLRRNLHQSARAFAIKPFLLADIGEGIRECEVIQWFVEPEARVEQFDKLCEVQSDKASVEITSRFDGVIKKLHYEAGDMAIVGKPLVDIDIQNEISPEDEAITTPPAEQAGTPSSPQQPQKAAASATRLHSAGLSKESQKGEHPTSPPPAPSTKHATLATPAIRHLTKEMKVNIADISGTGRDGRVLKEDVHKFVTERDAPGPQCPASSTFSQSISSGPQKESIIPLTPIQAQMFKTMTRSLSIPHFLYADTYKLNALTSLRKTLDNTNPSTTPHRLSALPFILKAVSLALHTYPICNARVDTINDSTRPHLVLREQHNIGVAMDTPQGLLVPNVKNVASLSIIEVAAELFRLQSLAVVGKLSATDLTGGTITVSNVGSIGGTYVAPVIVSSEVAILGIGRARVVPAFDDEGRVVKAEEIALSWSADHRVVDGATMARMAGVVGRYLEEPGRMLVGLR